MGLWERGREKEGRRRERGGVWENGERKEKGETGMYYESERRGEERCVCTYLGLVEESLIKEGILRTTSRRQP